MYVYTKSQKGMCIPRYIGFIIPFKKYTKFPKKLCTICNITSVSEFEGDYRRIQYLSYVGKKCLDI